MSSAIILDTETTGLDAPEVIQLAFTEWCNLQYSEEPTMTYMFKPSKPISYGAMATHHILLSDLEHADPWPGSWQVPTGIEYIIGHKIDFDWKAIGSPNVKRICTLALARSIWPDLDSHSLGALTYYLNDHQKARMMVRGAHDAATDVGLCSVLLSSIISYLNVDNWETLWGVSERARIPTHFTFGKYGPKDGKKGASITDVRQFDRGYIKWCLTSCDIVTGDPYWQKALTQ